MYAPSSFQVTDQEVIDSFLRENSFGILLTVADGVIHDTHTPFVRIGESVLMGHIARANPQWKSWEDATPAKVIFHGPHTYISPSYYLSESNVPTWNYTAVSISGSLTMVDDDAEALDFLDALTARNEPEAGGWKLDRTNDRLAGLLSGIVVFAISIDSFEASFKLNQNKSEEDRANVIRSLRATGYPMDREVARLMELNLGS